MLVYGLLSENYSMHSSKVYIYLFIYFSNKSLHLICMLRNRTFSVYVQMNIFHGNNMKHSQFIEHNFYFFFLFAKSIFVVIFSCLSLYRPHTILHQLIVVIENYVVMLTTRCEQKTTCEQANNKEMKKKNRNNKKKCFEIFALR